MNYANTWLLICKPDEGGDVTMSRSAATPPCPIGRAVEVLGERWTPLITRNATRAHWPTGARSSRPGDAVKAFAAGTA
ncbi:MAG: hypothetical protein JWL99_6588 [Streptomyces oryziradicis]|nr:hypothetical protein [Actinacidiphila oryziradicis]